MIVDNFKHFFDAPLTAKLFRLKHAFFGQPSRKVIHENRIWKWLFLRPVFGLVTS